MCVLLYFCHCRWCRVGEAGRCGDACFEETSSTSGATQRRLNRARLALHVMSNGTTTITAVTRTCACDCSARVCVVCVCIVCVCVCVCCVCVLFVCVCVLYGMNVCGERGGGVWKE